MGSTLQEKKFFITNFFMFQLTHIDGVRRRGDRSSRVDSSESVPHKMEMSEYL